MSSLSLNITMILPQNRLCSFRCSTLESIRKHILKTAKHRGERVYSCELCSMFGSDSASEFARHLGQEHSGVLETSFDVQSHIEGYFAL